jgi:type IX secretion system PorP/SprF family membrane protein
MLHYSKKLFMKLLYKWIVFVMMAWQGLGNCFAQDVGFSQFYDQPLLRNPALAGFFDGDMRFVASYRNQWQSISNPYRTFGLSAEFKMPGHVVEYDNITVGMQLIRDIAGTSQYSTTQILPAINYSLPLNAEDHYISLAFMGGLMQHRFDPTKLVMNDQFVSGTNGTFSILPASRQVFNNTNINYFDLSAGISYFGASENVNYCLGAGMFHLTKSQKGFFEGKAISLNKKLALNIGASGRTSETDMLTFYADYFKQFGEGFTPVGTSTLQAGLLFSHDLFVLDDIQKTITGGVLYRWDDAIIPVVQLQLSKFTIGASYDVNISKLVTASKYRGGFELVLSYRDFLNGLRQELLQGLCPPGRRIL